MTFKPAIWYPIAVGLSALNLVAVGFAVPSGDPLHVGAHAALALGFGLWAQRLRRGSDGSQLENRVEALEADVGDVGDLRRELSEMQERLDFAERLLAQGQDTHRVGPQP